jgi:hypothetical protein
VVIPAQAIGLGFEKPYDFSGLQARFIALQHVTIAILWRELRFLFRPEERCFSTERSVVERTAVPILPSE